MKSDLSKHRKPIIKSLIIAGLLITAFGLLLLHEVHGRSKLVSPPATPIFTDRYGTFLAEGTADEDAPLGFWDPPAVLPERIVACLLAIEDKRYYEHFGVDFRSLLRALVNNLSGGPRQGASTIAMQVARLQRPGERTLWRKACEMGTAVWLNRKYGHQNVLRHYLKIVPQGNRIHGVAYAARRYFRKPLADLSWTEAAILASLPRAPGRMNLYQFEGRRKAFERAKLILNLLHKNGTLDADNLAISQRQLKSLKIPVKESRPYHSYHAILRLQETMNGTDSYTKPVLTTLDLPLQEVVDSTAGEAMEQLRQRGAGNLAVIVAERETGAIRSYLGSDFYADTDFSGAINYATTPRSAGSTLKPFIYALGMETGAFSPASVLADLPFNLVHSRGQYSIHLGPMLYRKALANSRNIPAVHVLKTVGLAKTYDLFRQLGLAKDDRSASVYGLGLAIGGLYVTLEDLVAAYGVLGVDGKAFGLRWFETDDEEAPSQLIPEDVARQITLFLSDPLARLPTFTRMGPLEYPFPVAVKTGTSQGFRDAWAVAYSSKYIVGAWIGHPDHERMKQVAGLDAAQLVKGILLFLHPKERRGVDETPFPPPQSHQDSGGSVGYQLAKLCPMSGELATEACAETVLEYLLLGIEPTAFCPVHQSFAVDRRTGELAGPMTPPEWIEIRSYAVLSPQFAAWGAVHGYNPPPLPSTESPFVSIAIEEPVNGSVFRFHPDTPQQLQSIALRAYVSPTVPEIIWYVDGEPFQKVAYPYTTRWHLRAGSHALQARFPHADVQSGIITITVAP
ncbi:transglycosylase domain-containing protein [Candidatus Poribacteria bacterium]|nr:transglycosylase domain-containing protein [Candidatus Poribacteria bacterium]